MLPHGKHAPVPTILRPVAGIKLKWAHFGIKLKNFSGLTICYVIYVLLWINISFYSNLKKSPNISGIWLVLIIKFLFAEWMNEWMHLYSALLCIAVHPKHFTIMWGGGVSPQPPPVCSIHLEFESSSLCCWNIFIYSGCHNLFHNKFI